MPMCGPWAEPSRHSLAHPGRGGQIPPLVVALRTVSVRPSGGALVLIRREERASQAPPPYSARTASKTTRLEAGIVNGCGPVACGGALAGDAPAPMVRTGRKTLPAALSDGGSCME